MHSPESHGGEAPVLYMNVLKHSFQLQLQMNDKYKQTVQQDIAGKYKTAFPN